MEHCGLWTDLRPGRIFSDLVSQLGEAVLPRQRPSLLFLYQVCGRVHHHALHARDQESAAHILMQLVAQFQKGLYLHAACVAKLLPKLCAG